MDERKDAVATATAGAFRDLPPPQAGDQAAGNRFCGALLASKEMHRVGVASVQLTRSTFAEAIAGRESLQPRALRARCTRKPNDSFAPRQADRDAIPRKLRHSSFQPGYCVSGESTEEKCAQKCTEAGAPSSGLPTDLRRSDCLSESHQPPALRPRCTRDTRASRRARQARSEIDLRSLRNFLYKPNILAFSTPCSTWAGPRIRRAGCAFVHFPG
jgi:hypothetical protein